MVIQAFCEVNKGTQWLIIPQYLPKEPLYVFLFFSRDNAYLLAGTVQYTQCTGILYINIQKCYNTCYRTCSEGVSRRVINWNIQTYHHTCSEGISTIEIFRHVTLLVQKEYPQLKYSNMSPYLFRRSIHNWNIQTCHLTCSGGVSTIEIFRHVTLLVQKEYPQLIYSDMSPYLFRRNIHNWYIQTCHLTCSEGVSRWEYPAQRIQQLWYLL